MGLRYGGEQAKAIHRTGLRGRRLTVSQFGPAEKPLDAGNREGNRQHDGNNNQLCREGGRRAHWVICTNRRAKMSMRCEPGGPALR